MPATCHLNSERHVACHIGGARNLEGELKKRLNNEGLRDKAAWERAGVLVPRFDRKAMCAATEQAPVWVHFGAGNIFRGFIAVLQQRLLNGGLAQSGILAADTFDYDIIDRMYTPHDCMTLMVGLGRMAAPKKR